MPISRNDRDVAIRTIIGEAGNQPALGQSAVAHVLLNRLNAGSYGNSLSSVALAPNQFDAWRQQGQSLAKIDPNSAQYQQVGKTFDDAAQANSDDPTNGATHFLNPALVQKMPKWTNGAGLAIGDHTFYAPDNPNYGNPSAAIRAAINNPPSPDPMSAIRSAISSDSE